ncbi:MAG: EamA family transporter [Thermovenabulum sp.]|uniref:EamA family transporter n=1 Tax=Thermovenabulum sp. TaxID=3100335 RepID=UPI003C797687
MIYIIISIMLGSAGHIIAKYSTYNLKNIVGLTKNLYFYISAFCYGISYIFWLMFLRDKPLSIVVPLNSITYVIVAMLSHFIFGEQLKPIQYIGIAVIILGISLLEQ